MKASIIKISILFLIFTLTSETLIFAQKRGHRNSTKNENTRQYRNTDKTRWIIWFIPSRVRRINGVAFGIVNPCENENFQSELTINGLSFELIGQVPQIIGQLIFPKMNPNCHSNYCRTNGISLGLSVGAGKMNGFAFSPTIGHIYNLNGIFICPIQHISQDGKGFALAVLTRANNFNGAQIGLLTKNQNLQGLQIGLFNRTTKYASGVQIGLINVSDEMDGVQIGLINVIKSKKTKFLPFINFRF